MEEDSGLLTLVVTGTDGSRLTFDLDEAEQVSIGRSRDNTVVLDDASVSRHHAELLSDGTHWTLHDRGSHNGTYINGRRVAPSAIGARHSAAARIGVGRFKIQVRAPTAKPETSYRDAGPLRLAGVDRNDHRQRRRPDSPTRSSWKKLKGTLPRRTRRAASVALPAGDRAGEPGAAGLRVAARPVR